MVINSHLVDERLQVTTFGAADGRPFFLVFIFLDAGSQEATAREQS